MTILLTILKEIGLMVVTMAPYLLFGFLMAGILSIVISKDFIRRHLGGSGWKQSAKAALIGIPLPICSCGIIPLAASLRKQGASRGATASFLASTPQTGIDSLMITYALLGWGFALFRTLMAFISGVICGISVTAVSPKEKNDNLFEEQNDMPASPAASTPLIPRVFSYAFLSLPRMIARSMMIGIIISGVISALIPDDFFMDHMGNSFLTLVLMLFIGIPLYVCSSGSVPIALAFIKAGLSPGAALVFLITGPATNAATITTLWKIIGKKQLLAFLLALAGCALAAGAVLNALDTHLNIAEYATQAHQHHGWFDYLCAVMLVIVLINGMLPLRKREKTQAGR